MSGNNAINCKLLRYAVLSCIHSADVMVKKGGGSKSKFSMSLTYTQVCMVLQTGNLSWVWCLIMVLWFVMVAF